MHGFNEVIWLSSEQVEGLRRSPKPTIPITIFGFDSNQRRLKEPTEMKSIEFAFLPWAIPGNC